MEAADRLHFGALLRQFRLEAGLTQQHLAERAKLSVEAISTLERGARTRPYHETVTLLAYALKLPPDRQALLERAADIAHRPRRRESIEGAKPAQLRIVGSGAKLLQRNNLPLEATSLVGRQSEVREIEALLRRYRLVTVVGAGGVGKTRTATQTGNALSDEYADGVWLVDLAPLVDENLVASAVLNALQLPFTTGSALGAAAAYLKTRTLVLILDNCEHVVAEAGKLAATIVASCPTVCVLATSRQPLGCPGERIYRLPSLPIPPDPCSNLQDASRYDGVALFIDRARAAEPRFTLTAENFQDVSHITRRLDGIPLAIELAAARVKVLTPHQIAQRLNQRFRLLTDGDSAALPRHRTMSALMNWSYDLLSPREQRFFERLSVFAGGCTLDAATVVCTSEREDDLDVIDLIESLASKSLLVAELVGNEQRYRLLETSRQYASAKLTAHGEAEALSRRHALFYVELAEQLEREWYMMPDHEWLPQAARELENWRISFEWALTKRGDTILGQRLAAVRPVMLRGFPIAEGRRWIRAAIASIDDSTPARLVAQLEHSEADGARRAGEFKAALDAAECALSRYRGLGDVPGIATMQSFTGVILAVLGRAAEGRSPVREALETAETIGDSQLRAVCLHRLGLVESVLGDYTRANAYLNEALGAAKTLGATILMAAIGTALSQNAYFTGDPETALRLTDGALTDYRSLGSPAVATNIACTLADKSTYLIALGRYDEARTQAQEALVLARSLDFPFMICRSLQHLALAALIRSQAEGELRSVDRPGAARLFGFIEARLSALGDTEDLDRSYYQSALALLREAIGADQLAHLMSTGAIMTEDEAIAQARALEDN